MKVLVRQIGAFLIVGLAASACHVFVALILARFAGFSPLSANFAAYLCAVGISYLGHARYTFGRSAKDSGQLLKFLIVSLLGLVCTQATTLLLVEIWNWPFALSLMVVSVVTPAVTFTAARLWVFAARGRTPGPAA